MIHKFKNEILKDFQIFKECGCYVSIITITTLFVIYIFPSFLTENYFNIPIEKFIFIVLISIVNIGYILKERKINKEKQILSGIDILLISTILLSILFTKNINYLTLIPLIFTGNIVKNKEKFTKIVTQTNLLYVCAFFVMLYSIILFGKIDDRFIHTAIGEKNLSGLAIFLLAILASKKNKIVSITIGVAGLFTFSRSYILAIIVVLLSKIKFLKRALSKLLQKRKFLFNYSFLTYCSNIVLLALGVLFIELFKNGYIVYNGDNIETRLFNIFDYSNLFRFFGVYVIFKIFITKPTSFLFGISDDLYVTAGSAYASEIGLPYQRIIPHNLFLSHFMLYGFASIVETAYISKILKKILNKENSFIFIAIFLYSILLGAGLYSYWLYASMMALILFNPDKNTPASNAQLDITHANQLRQKARKTKMKKESIAVSVLCLAYNHEKYIRKALESIISQKTNFAFEVIINDDCSTDNTRNIIKEYQSKYPDIIKPIFQKENQYSKGTKMLKDILMPAAHGKYLALCECDDYWIDEYKLQKQFDFMEKNPDYSFCISNAQIVNEAGIQIGKIQPSKKGKVLNTEDIILLDGGGIATNSIFTKTEYRKNIPDYFNNFSIDYLWQIFFASLGKTYCFGEYMVAYRENSAGSWSERMQQNPGNRIKMHYKLIAGLKAANENLEYKFNKEFQKKINEYELLNVYFSEKYDKLKKDPYKSYLKEADLNLKCKIFLKKNLRPFFNLAKSIKHRSRKGKII